MLLISLERLLGIRAFAHSAPLVMLFDFVLRSNAFEGSGLRLGLQCTSVSWPKPSLVREVPAVGFSKAVLRLVYVLPSTATFSWLETTSSSSHDDEPGSTTSTLIIRFLNFSLGP